MVIHADTLCFTGIGRSPLTLLLFPAKLLLSQNGQWISLFFAKIIISNEIEHSLAGNKRFVHCPNRENRILPGMLPVVCACNLPEYKIWPLLFFILPLYKYSAL
jgi:hypothetical protein